MFHLFAFDGKGVRLDCRLAFDCVQNKGMRQTQAAIDSYEKSDMCSDFASLPRSD